MTNDGSAERDVLQRAFEHALAGASASRCLPRFLAGLPRRGPALVLGTGKAAAAMAAAFCSAWPDRVRGLAVTRYGHGLEAGEEAGAIDILEAGHPLPDDSSLAGGARLLALARQALPGESLWCLISGGGSAASAVPLPGITLAEKRAAADFLMRRGADIRTLNCVRKHLSALKGGRLAAAAHPSPLTTLAVSDVPGDHLEDIASGPTIPDPTTQLQARAILERFAYPGRAQLAAVLRDPALESPKPGDPAFAGDSAHVIACAATALDAAEAFLRGQGFQVHRLGDDLDGEAQALGREHARLARRIARGGSRTALLSGGETRVVLGDRPGRGGRNLEYLAGLALELAGCPGVWALAADTDGIDGNADHAGGIVVPEILTLGERRGVKLDVSLAKRDTYRYFEACRLLVKTGPTRTNVNDFRLILCQQSVGAGRA